jgi:poly(hydroxyalkanoate) granule-associated protein
MATRSDPPEDGKPAAGASAIPPLFDSQLAGAIKESAAQIWQAGLGAFAKAQGEGGKVYESLVKEGVSIQRKTQAAAEEKLGEVSGRMSKLSEEVQTKAVAQWDRLESIFEERVAKAMGRMGAPTAAQLAALSYRMDALEASIAKLSRPVSPVKKSAARPAVKKAVSAKRAPAKKAAAKRKTG